MSRSISVLCAAFAAGSLLLVACEKKADPATPKPTGTTAADTHGHEHADGAEHVDGDKHPAGDHDDHEHGEEVNLGSQVSGEFTFTAAHDGPITEGAEVPVDFAITKMPAGTTISSVRVWIGNATGTGSMKAKAELEGDGYHAHVEVPKPIPTDARVWVEVETSTGPAQIVSFEMKK